MRAGVVGMVAFVAAYGLSGGLPGEAPGLLAAPVLGAGGLALGVLSINLIGSFAVWLHDTTPLYWVWQKLLFTLGGLLLPLEIYPEWLRSVAQWTPFAAMLNGPARLVFSFDIGDAVAVAGRLAIWSGLLALMMLAVWRRAARNLEGHGG